MQSKILKRKMVTTNETTSVIYQVEEEWLVKSLEEIVKTSKRSFDHSTHCIGDGEATGRGLSSKNTLDCDGLNTEAVEEAVVTAWHASRLLQGHVDQGSEWPGKIFKSILFVWTKITSTSYQDKLYDFVC